MNQADIRAALAYLTLELDKQTFSSWHDRDKTELSTDSKTFGSVTLEQSTETIRNPFQRIIHFSLFVEGDKLSQGIVGYTSILYANSKQQLLFREALLEKESIRSVITIKHTGNTGRQIAIILFNKVGEKTLTLLVSYQRGMLSIMLIAFQPRICFPNSIVNLFSLLQKLSVIQLSKSLKK